MGQNTKAQKAKKKTGKKCPEYLFLMNSIAQKLENLYLK